VKASYRKTTHRLITAARRISKALRYATLSGAIHTAVNTGRLIRTSDFLTRIGGDDLPDGQKSWFGRHVAKAHRATTGTEPLKVWAQHRTTGRWIHVFVYGPIDLALYEGLRTYKGTQHLLASNYAEAA
jgi:hypothetical protein